MTNEEFDARVAQLEQLAQRDLRGYKIRLLLLAALGNAYLVAVVLLLIALLAASVAMAATLHGAAIKLILVVGLFLWMVLKALWIVIPAPDGIEISARKSPALFELIEELRRAADAPRFDHVLVTDDFNAGVVQAPRFGLLGGYRSYLLIGLPLMKGLTVEQFKAVLAHEFGHLARGHGRISGWIYRQRIRWLRLMNALESSESAGGFLFKPFFRWFAPYFSAYAFPLARTHEYEADSIAAKLTSTRAAAEALTTVSVVGDYLGEKYWPGIHKQADEVPRPAFSPYSNMAHGVATELDDASAKLWLERALARQTTSDDTHPALSDRLRALGIAAELAPPAADGSADALLGDSLPTISEIFDRRWQENILGAWQDRYRSVQEDLRKLADLDARAASDGELPVDEACERAMLTESAGKNPDASFAQFRALYERAPEHALVCYFVGIGLLARDDDEGTKMLEKSMSLAEDLSLSCLRALRDYCERRGRQEEAQAWRQRLFETAELQEAAAAERSTIRIDDRFDRADLAPEALAQIREQLSRIPGLKGAYLVKKRVRHLTHRPCYVLGYSVAGMLSKQRERRSTEVMEQILRMTCLPEGTRIFNVQGNNSRFGRKFFWMRGARLL